MTGGMMSHKEYLKAIGITPEAETKMKEDVYEIIKRITSTSGKNIPLDEMPEIKIIPGDSSAYDSNDNLIEIARDKMGNGMSYAAEVGHFLRSYYTNNIEKKTSRHLAHLKVEEFYDRVTSQRAKELFSGTELERLFLGKNKDYSSEVEMRNLRNWRKNAKKELKRNPPQKGYHSYEKADLLQSRSHESYAIADKIASRGEISNLFQIPDFYQLEDEEVLNRFFKKKGLENKLGLITSIGMIIGAILLNYPNFTGNIFSIGLSNPKNILSLFLIILGLFGFIFYYKKNIKIKNI